MRNKSPRPGAGDGAFGIVDIAEDRQTTPVIGVAIEGRADMARRALQQPDAQPRLELLDGVSHRRARQSGIFGRQREAAPFHDAGEHPHGIEPVHRSVRHLRIISVNNARSSGERKGISH